MKLTAIAIEKMNNKRVLSVLALALDKSEMSIRRYKSENKDNGPLTTVRAIQVLKRETGLTQTEILEGNNHTVAA